MSNFKQFLMENYVSLIGLLLSVLAVVITLLPYAFTSEADTQRSLYSAYFDISKTELAAPETLHVVMLPENYQAVKADVMAAIADSKTQPSKLAKLRLEERAMADYLFSIYEATLIDYDTTQGNFHSFKGIAEEILEPSRHSFDEEALQYLSDLLRNPRLLYYWDLNGGGLCREYIERTIEYYDAHVFDPALKPDWQGPFGTAKNQPASHAGKNAAVLSERERKIEADCSEKTFSR